MVYLGTNTFAHGATMTSDPGDGDISLPGLLAAATWAVGLVLGLLALTSGHELLAGLSLVLAIMSPWFGLAFLAHGQRADVRRQQRAAMVVADQITSYPYLHRAETRVLPRSL
jgi:hypothetical protein